MISVLPLCTIDYATGLRLQQRLVDLRKDGRIGDVLLLLEHNPVITLGRNAKASNLIDLNKLGWLAMEFWKEEFLMELQTWLDLWSFEQI